MWGVICRSKMLVPPAVSLKELGSFNPFSQVCNLLDKFHTCLQDLR